MYRLSSRVDRAPTHWMAAARPFHAENVFMTFIVPMSEGLNVLAACKFSSSFICNALPLAFLVHSVARTRYLYAAETVGPMTCYFLFTHYFFHLFYFSFQYLLNCSTTHYSQLKQNQYKRIENKTIIKPNANFSHAKFYFWIDWVVWWKSIGKRALD